MKRAFQCVTLFAASIAPAVGVLAQEPALPAGNWQSVASEIYSHPLHAVLTGAEFYLNIDVSKDGSFRGEWRKYSCSGASVGAYGRTTFPCHAAGQSERVSGRFGPGRQGVIDLGGLGRSAFDWARPAVDELAIDLPKNWKGDAILYRARLTRDGKRRPATDSPPAGDSGPLLSANALYREFNKDEKAALARYAGKTLVLEGRRGTLIPLSDGGAAIHIADGFTARALVLVFRQLKEVDGISENEQFRFRCTVEHFDHFYVQMKDCSIVRRE